MASIQHNGFSQSQNYLSQIFKALAHPARMAIIEKLLADEKVICKEFAYDFPLSQATISSHLKVLLESGVLGYEKIGNVTYYVINPMILESTKSWITETIDETQRQEHDYRGTYFKFLPMEVN
ncbi:MAG: ArsR/SmtB family transcription factor [Fluviicola sp.]